MIKWMFAKAGKLSGKGGAAPDYEKAKIQAASADPAERARLASMSQLQPEFLYYFASDKSPDVRREVAKNEGTPIQADIILARDPDELVRQELGGKIARLMPDLSFEENEKLAAMVLEVVETLSQDAAPVVRSVVAESIKSRDDIPKRIVDRLAQDTEAVVSVPVIQFSPLLTDDDLLALIDIGRSGSLLAMARRAFLGEGVSQKIAENGDDRAVEALLKNKNAKIPEATLSQIVDEAEEKEAWQEPIAHRPDLTLSMIKRFAGYVGSGLLDQLITNNVLVDEKLGKELRQDAEARFAEEAAADDVQKEDDIFENLPDDEGKVRKILIKAIHDGDRNTVVACFAKLCPADIADMRKAMLSQDPKVGVSLSWHCKLTSEHARDLQAGVMGIAETSVMVPEGGAAVAMSEDDMAWVLQLQGVTT